MASIDPNLLPYRPCVGIMLLNKKGQIWVGRRFDDLVQLEVQKRWQMPQGGIDDGEEPKRAALRELHEETGVSSVKILAESQGWIKYDLPAEAVGKALKGKYRGQQQKWFAMRFTGVEDEINLKPDGHKQEFDAWRWVDHREVLDLIVGFKRPTYEVVLREFSEFLAP
ncbi:MAG: RNA pyrophosphohydrolase [Rhodomicrobium sp.]